MESPAGLSTVLPMRWRVRESKIENPKSKIQMSTVTLGLLQHACSPSPAENLKKTLALVAKAARRGANIICTQELFRSQYFCQKEDYDSFKLAEPIPGPTTKVFQALAKKHGCVIIASLFEKRAAGLYHNTAVVIDADGALLGKYRKMHIPDDPAYYEKFYFTPGDTGFRAWDTKFGRIGVLICWDQWYPEAARGVHSDGPIENRESKVENCDAAGVGFSDARGVGAAGGGVVVLAPPRQDLAGNISAGAGGLREVRRSDQSLRAGADQLRGATPTAGPALLRGSRGGPD